MPTLKASLFQVANRRFDRVCPEGRRFPILLTATLRPNSEAISFINDVTERVEQYASTLRWLICDAQWRPGVVFAENSGYEFREAEALKALAKRNGVPIEFITKLDDSPKFWGKGYSEGRIIENALSTSALLAGTDGFFKLTGRMKVSNLRWICRSVNRHLDEGGKLDVLCQDTSRAPKYLHTQFFWSRKQYYEEHLLQIYRQVNDQNDVILENLWAKALFDGTQRGDAVFQLPFPVLVQGRHGVNGHEVMVNREVFRQWRKVFAARNKSLLPLAGPS